jgi:hypothetical protein
MIRCDSNQRCEACPIGQLPNADDRVKAGNVVRSVTRVLLAGGEDNISTLSFGNLKFVASERAAFLHAEEFTAPIIGATAISLAGECKVEE